MSDYIPVGGYGGLQQSQGRPQVKSVYYPPQQQPSQQQLNQCPQGSSQLPSGAAVPVINMIQTPPGVTLLSFQQDVSATVPPELQQQLKQLQQQQQSQQLPPQNNNVPTYVSSDYAATGWETAYRTTPVRVINLPQQQQQQAGGQQGAGLIPNIALEAARSEYEQAVAQAQRAAERLGQISGVQPQVQFSGFSQASGQQGFGGGLPAGQQGFGGGLPSGQQGFGGGFNPQQQQGGYGGGLNAQQQQCQGQQQQCPLQPQKQVQFSGVQQQRRLTPSNSSYNFEQSGPAGGRTFNQAQNESVYIGMPNNLYLASNRPRDYHFQPQRQESNTNLLRTARESSSGTKLRASQSDENIRTAVLNEEGKVVGVVETRYNQPSQGQQVAAGSSSDYHFDALRGLNSAY